MMDCLTETHFSFFFIIYKKTDLKPANSAVFLVLFRI
jgi:hypothetical protein